MSKPSGLLTPRATYAPILYPRADEFWELQHSVHWLPNEVQMGSDIYDFNFKLSETEKHIITQILNGFVTTEIFVEDYWAAKVSRWFKHPEIQRMSHTFAAFETIHAKAYALLNESLDIMNFEAFLEEPAAKAKIDRIVNIKAKTPHDIAKSLAVFSAFTEGVNLFSSFAVLMSFQLRNLMHSTGKIVEYSVRDECVTPETECLTQNGWVRIDSLHPEDKIAQWNPDTSEVSFIVPSRVVVNEIDEDIVLFSADKMRVSQRVTKGHRIPFRWNKYKQEPSEFRFEVADKFKPGTSKQLPVSGFLNSGGSGLSNHERFLIALQADGSMSDRYTGEIVGTRPILFTLTKDRKKNRMNFLLEELGYSYKTVDKGNGRVTYKVNAPVDKTLSKTFDWVRFDEISSVWAEEFLDEVVLWDGHQPSDRNSTYYSSSVKTNVDVIQALASLCGKWTTYYTQEDNRKESYKTIHRLSIHNTAFKRTGTVNKTYERYKGKVYCPTVPTGVFIIRHDNTVSVTGNCLHAEAGIWLFNTLIHEYPELNTPELKEEIIEAARYTVELEDNFIDSVFDMGEMDGMTSKQLKNYIRYRTNIQLNKLGYASNWKNIDMDLVNSMSWFDSLTSGVQHQDFFAGRVSDYAKATINLEGVWND